MKPTGIPIDLVVEMADSDDVGVVLHKYITEHGCEELLFDATALIYSMSEILGNLFNREPLDFLRDLKANIDG